MLLDFYNVIGVKCNNVESYTIPSTNQVYVVSNIMKVYPVESILIDILVRHYVYFNTHSVPKINIVPFYAFGGNTEWLTI